MNPRAWLALLGACAAVGACQSESTSTPSQPSTSGSAGFVSTGAAAGADAGERPSGGAASVPSTAGAGAAVLVQGGGGASGGAAGQPSNAGAAGAPQAGGCRLANLPVCLDFEDSSPLVGWQQSGEDIDVSEAEHAHGRASLRFGNLKPNKQATITTSALPGVSNVLWGRFFLYMDAGAPNGHGALVNAFDQDGNWYELGFQFSSFHGNWHVPEGVPERWMNSKAQVPAKVWSCVEFLFDGSTAAETQIWSNGELVEYTQKADSPEIQTVSRFDRITIGFMAYHGTSLTDYGGDTPPSATQMYIDDIALGPQRIGCDPVDK